MIGGFFVFRSLSRRSKLKAVSGGATATHASTSVKSSKLDDDFYDNDGYDERYETGEFDEEEKERRNREEDPEERWGDEVDGQDDNGGSGDDD